RPGPAGLPPPGEFHLPHRRQLVGSQDRHHPRCRAFVLGSTLHPPFNCVTPKKMENARNGLGSVPHLLFYVLHFSFCFLCVRCTINPLSSSILAKKFGRSESAEERRTLS